MWPSLENYSFNSFPLCVSVSFAYAENVRTLSSLVATRCSREETGVFGSR